MQLPSEVPVMILPNTILFPQAMLPLYIFEPRYRRMLADVLNSHRMFAMALQKPGVNRESPCPIAGLGLVRASVDHPDGTSHLYLQGISRVELTSTVRYKPYRVCRIRPLEVEVTQSDEIDALATKVRELVMDLLRHGAQFSFPILQQLVGNKDQAEAQSLATEALEFFLSRVRDSKDAGQLADLVSGALLPSPILCQAVLETADVTQRLQLVVQFLIAELRRGKKRKSS